MWNAMGIGLMVVGAGSGATAPRPQARSSVCPRGPKQCPAPACVARIGLSLVGGRRGDGPAPTSELIDEQLFGYSLELSGEALRSRGRPGRGGRGGCLFGTVGAFGLPLLLLLLLSFSIGLESGDEISGLVLGEPTAGLALIETERATGIFEVGMASTLDECGQVS